MTLSCAVMAHPKREAMVAELAGWLDRPIPVVWDERNDRHDTGIRAMTAYDPACSHHLVLQDDVVPCRDLLAGVERALKWTPQDVPVSLYIGRVRPFRRSVEAAVNTAGNEASWITMAGIYWGPAVIFPSALIDDMAAWFRESIVSNYDRRMSTWCVQHGITCWYTWPSLVDHRGTVSLVRDRGPAERRAHRFHDGSALDVDWSGPVVNVAGTERLDRRRQQLAGR